jgi:GNAT superfamily N-acetyltransferase
LLDVRSRFEVAETYVAVTAGRIVGSVAFYPDVGLEGWSNLPAGWAGFRALVADPDVRGAGVGRTLIDHCIHRAQEVGAPVLGIHTARSSRTQSACMGASASSAAPSTTSVPPTCSRRTGPDDMVGLAFRYPLAT